MSEQTILENNSSARLYKWDNIKFFLILCVVLGHFSSGLLGISSTTDFVFLYTLSFHMPLFIFINGLFTKSYREKPINANRIFGLLTICLLYKLLLLTVNIIFKDGPVTTSIFSDTSAPWYLFVLVIFMVITYLLRNIRPVYVMIFSIVLSLIAGYDPEIGKSMSRIIYFYPYFYAGYICEPSKIAKALDKLWFKIVAVIGLAVFAIFIYKEHAELINYRNLGTGLGSYRAIEIYVNNGESVGMIHRLSTYLVAIIMSVFVISLIPNRKIPCISDMGTRTLQVYVLHRPLLLIMQCLQIPRWIKYNITWSHWAVPWLLLGVLMTVLLSFKFIEKPFNKLMDNKIKIPPHTPPDENAGN